MCLLLTINFELFPVIVYLFTIRILERVASYTKSNYS